MSKKCAKICRIGKMVVTLHSQIGETEMQTLKRCGSSAWLEYMPVTHGVASSSLVRTAVERGNEQFSLRACCSFFCIAPSSSPDFWHSGFSGWQGCGVRAKWAEPIFRGTADFLGCQ